MTCASAPRTITKDIFRNAARYPAGNPIRDLPALASEIEREVKRGRLDEARRRAALLDKVIKGYESRDEDAAMAKLTLERRVRHVLSTEG
ncbi:MAG: hypothetical protein JOY59_01365 [Candidatus Eremiobacteraeota bacterium]|nr:hypothetical protein [Candidatus Eremiobacteraeota bacterium]